MATQKSVINYYADYEGIPRAVFSRFIKSLGLTSPDQIPDIASYYGALGKANNGNWTQAGWDYMYQKPVGIPDSKAMDVPSADFDDFNLLSDMAFGSAPAKAKEAIRSTVDAPIDATKEAAAKSYDWIRSIGFDFVFVLGGMALIVASIWAALHGQSFPSLVTNAGKMATKL